MHCYMVSFTGTFTKYFCSGFCLCVFSSKFLRPYNNLANFCNLCDHFQPKLKSPFRPQSIKFTKNCFYLVNLSLQWLHLQALFWSGFCLCVFSSKYIRPYCDLPYFFSDLCQLFEHYCQYSSTSYLPGSDEYLYLSNYG